MSEHGRAARLDPARLAEILDIGRVRRHRGTTADCLRRYREFAAETVSTGMNGLRAVTPQLLGMIADERTLYTAWEHLAANGGDAPGPDGLRYDQFTPASTFKICRSIRDDIVGGRYAPDEEYVRWVLKSSGRGFRPIVLQSIFDRVVQRAVVEVFQPLLDPLFDSRSFGYRPKRGPFRALATAMWLCGNRPRGVWVSVDIADAFTNVPIGRLLGVLRRYLPDDRLLAFVELVVRSPKVAGLRQGGPLSPLLLNLYLHHLLDRKWRRLHPKIPLLRFADDILLLCETEEQARAAYATLTGLLRAAGLRLKEDQATSIRRVAEGQSVTWLGFEIHAGEDDGLQVAIGRDAWVSLEESLARAHDRPLSPLAAVASIGGWVADKAPCFATIDFDWAYARIGRLAAAQGFEEVPESYEVLGLWQRAYARWCKLCRRVGITPARSLGRRQGPGRPRLGDYSPPARRGPARSRT
jgi:hypothetical protein